MLSGAKACIFCKIITGEIPCTKVYEDDDVLAFLDAKPINPGHTLVVPKRHCENLLDCGEKELNAVMRAVQKISREKVKNGAAGVKVVCNNGKAAGQIIFHLHFHVIPF